MSATRVEGSRWRRLKNLWSGNNRVRLMSTLYVAVMAPAAALIYVNYDHLKSIERDKVLEAAIHRDFSEVLAISEKQINKEAYRITEEARALFPSPDSSKEIEVEQLDRILSTRSCLAHAFLFDADRGLLFRSQPARLGDAHFAEEHERLAAMFGGWFEFEGKAMVEGLRKRPRATTWYSERGKRKSGYAYLTTAFFTLPGQSPDRIVLAGVTFEPDYLKHTFFPGMLEQLTARKRPEEGANRLAMSVFPSEPEGGAGATGQPRGLLAASAGWTDGKPEVVRNLEEVFRGLALGIKFEGTSVEALGRVWVRRSLVILGVLSLLLVAGLVLTYRSVSKEVELARLKSDFVSNVSHELRTPLSLIRLYAETLELGRVNAREKGQEYYRIIRTESERLTALINNILDFSRIEAGRKEYDFRPTNLAALVENTLDAYRAQIDEQGFTLQLSVDPDLPPVRVDREAIARSIVNLVNNALKYSDSEKFLAVNLYRADGVLKLDVVDRGIGIARSEQSKIFEKFYRAGDPLVHNTKGSGLGLSLVRHIARAHGGGVDVASTLGKGSTFTLWLPMTLATAQASDDAA